MNFKENDLVYVDLKHQGHPPLCAISKYKGSTTIEDPNIVFDIIETQHHGIVYIDSDASEIKKLKV